jgi:hypothetical protein
VALGPLDYSPEPVAQEAAVVALGPLDYRPDPVNTGAPEPSPIGLLDYGPAPV